MSEIVEFNRESNDDLENKIADYYIRTQNLINNQITILASITDEGSILCDKKGNVLADTTSQKLEEVIKELEMIKKETEITEKIELFLQNIENVNSKTDLMQKVRDFLNE